MNFILIYILFTLFGFIYTFILQRMSDKQRALPLPKEVSDVYDHDRYETFLAYKSDLRKHYFKFKVITTVVDIVFILGGFYKFIDSIGSGNEYLVLLYTFLSIIIITTPIDYISEYISTFTIKEKYNQNKKTKKEFNKDYFLTTISNDILSTALYLLLIFVVQTISHSNLYPMTIGKAFLISIILIIILVIAMLVITLVSLFILKKTYTFTELEDGELKDKIHSLLKGVKKKIYHIYVYDESKKSISKNAFVLHFLFYREISVADNFITQNAEDELLAVIAHEVGHLKHKKTLLEYLSYITLVILFLVLTYVVYNPSLLSLFVSWINSSFGITTTNYSLVVLAIATFFTPISFITSIFSNYISRVNEYEADQNAVKEGYGAALIKTFKELSNDELVDVNPCAWIEITEYNHPGMANRIKAIEKTM